MTKESFGDRLARLRESQGLTQRQVADTVGLSLQQISEYERGRRNPPTDKLIALANLFHVSTDYLLCLTDDPAPASVFRVSRDYPLPPKGYEDLSPEEREEVDRITREFEDFQIQRILERKRNRQRER